MHKKSIYKYIPFVILLILMYVIHRYIFIYADDLYYSRDAHIGLSYLPEFMLKQLNLNGRVWVHVVLLFLVKYDALLFRIVNPIIITLTALLIAKTSSFDGESRKFKNIFPAAIISSILFLCISPRIASTTIFYAACSLNYLYPTAVAILFGYMLYKFHSNRDNINKISWLCLIVGFFAASSTQQAGMIAIGFAVMISLYFIIIKKYKFKINYASYFISLFIGYGFVTYGSLKRMLFEKNNGTVIKVTDTITSLLKTNIFSKPVSIFVLLICLCSIIWLIHFTFNNITRNKFINIFNILLALGLILSIFAYLYVVVIQKFDIIIFSDQHMSLKIRLFYIGFTLIYLFTILYISILIMIYKYNPFILFCTINAIGAQVMMLVADSRFAGAYKIIFPSLLLMFIFITYTFSELYNNRLFVFNKPLFVLIILLLSLVSFKIYYTNYTGYKETSKEIIYNLEAIKKYQESSDKTTLTLKKVPPSNYGYNLNNWNELPYFMKQCYKINEDTIVNFIE